MKMTLHGMRLFMQLRSRLLCVGLFSIILSLFVVYGNTFADELTLSIDTNNLAVNLMPLASSDSFAKSNDMNISVSTTFSSGYTLSIASSTGFTDLTSTSSSNNKINSIDSAIPESVFSNASNVQYNNKWGYKPSQFVVTNDVLSVVNNTDFRPLPTDSGEIIAKTECANDTSSCPSVFDSYTLSIGARITGSTPVGSYVSDTFIISAVTNYVPPLVINYDSNGGFFGGDSSRTVNTVNYNANRIATPVYEKYSHTGNVDDNGVAHGVYGKNDIFTEVITIPDAVRMHVVLTYSTDVSDDYVVFWTGSHPDYTAENDYSTGNQCGGRGPKFYNYGPARTVECDISTDALTFSFFTEGWEPEDYTFGYYAILTGYDSNGNILQVGEDITYSKTSISGSYMAPTRNSLSTYSYAFLGWSEDAMAVEAIYRDELEVSSKLAAVGGDTVTLYAIWRKAAYMQDLTSNSIAELLPNVGDIAIGYDRRDSQAYTITKFANGQYWMNSDLNVAGGTALYSADSDVPSGFNLSPYYTLPASPSSPNFIVSDPLDASTTYVYNTDNTDCRTVCYSTYSWIAATAGGKDSGGNDIRTYNAEAPYSICPKGWHLPTTSKSTDSTTNLRSLAISFGGSNSVSYYSSSTSPTGSFMTSQLTSSPYSFNFTGYYFKTSFGHGGTSGYYWTNRCYSSSWNGGPAAYHLGFSNSYADFADYYYMGAGMHIRCVFGG